MHCVAEKRMRTQGTEVQPYRVVYKADWICRCSGDIGALWLWEMDVSVAIEGAKRGIF